MKGGKFNLSKIALRLKGKYKFTDVVKRTKKSEINLINSYEEMDKKTKRYNKSYVEHLENVKMLDDFLNFNGIETLFTKIIMKDNFVKGHIDRSYPLLFSNYKIKGDIVPSDMRKEHLMAQIKYIINKSFPGSEHTFLKNLEIGDISKKDFVLNVTTIDNAKDKKIISHTDFIVDKPILKSAMRDIFSNTKKKLKRTSIVGLFSTKGSSGNSKNSKNSKKSKKSKNSSVYHISNIINKKDKLNTKKKNSKNKNENKIHDYFKIPVGDDKENTKKSVINRKLTEYMTSYEKYKRNNNDKAKAKAQADAKAKALAEAQAKAYKPADPRGAILGAQNYTSPIKEGFPQERPERPVNPYQQQNEVDMRCKSYGDDEATCKANYPACYFTPYQKCIKSRFYQNPNMAANQKPNIFANQKQKQADPFV